MFRTLLGVVFLTLTLSAPPPLPASYPPPARPLSEPAQGTFTFWFEPRGLSPEQAEVVASGFAAIAQERAQLVPAGRREEADLLVRMDVAAPGTTLGSRAPQIGAAGAGAEIDLAAREWTTPTIEVHLSLVDILDGSVLSERRVSCELPLTQGSFMTAACLRVNFPAIVQRMEEWVEREAATAETARDFGPSEADRRRLRPADLARAYYREGVQASQAGFEEQALDLMGEAQPLFKEAGLRREEGAAWEHLAYLMAVTNRDAGRAIDYAEQTVRIARELADPVAEARALNLLAACEARTGNYTRAARIARSAAAAVRESGDPLIEGTSMAILAGLAAVRGNLDQARALQAQASALVGRSGNVRAEARLQLSIAAVTARDDDRLQSTSLALLEEVRERALELGDLALLRDVTFVQADVRYATTELALLNAGEVDAIRALKLARRLDDHTGEAAALGLLGAIAMRLGKPSVAFDYLVIATDRARDVGFLEGLTDGVQLLGEISPDIEDGASLLERVLELREEEGDLRGQIKTLSDLSRLQAALERNDEAWESYRSAAAAVEDYVAQLQENTDGEDIRESFTTVLKSLVTTRTELPYLVRYLKLNHMVPLPNPNWVEG